MCYKPSLLSIFCEFKKKVTAFLSDCIKRDFLDVEENWPINADLTDEDKKNIVRRLMADL